MGLRKLRSHYIRSSSRGQRQYEESNDSSTSSTSSTSTSTSSNSNQNTRMTTRSISRAKKEEDEKNRLGGESFIPFPGFHDYAMFFSDYKQMVDTEREQYYEKEKERKERDNRKPHTFDFSGLFLLCLYGFIVFSCFMKLIGLDWLNRMFL